MIRGRHRKSWASGLIVQGCLFSIHLNTHVGVQTPHNSPHLNRAWGRGSCAVTVRGSTKHLTCYIKTQTVRVHVCRYIKWNLCLCYVCVCCDVNFAASAGLLSTRWHHLSTDLQSSVFMSASRLKRSRDVNNGNPHLLHFLPVTDASACTLREADVNKPWYSLMCDNRVYFTIKIFLMFGRISIELLHNCKYRCALKEGYLVPQNTHVLVYP